MQRTPEPGDPDLQRMIETAAILDALREAAALNKAAARWTAGAVILSMVAAITGAFSS
jgi:hypothetical protein